MLISLKVGDRYVFTDNIMPLPSTNASVSAAEEDGANNFAAQLEAETDKLNAVNQSAATNNANQTNAIGTTDAAGAAGATGAAAVNNSTYQSMAPESMAPIFKKAADTYGMDQKLLELVAMKESNFNTYAKSSSGAMGIMQLMPATAESLGVDNPYDAESNIMAGAKLLKQFFDDNNGNIDLMLASYNAGPGAVKKYGGVPPYEQTQNYVKWIKERYP